MKSQTLLAFLFLFVYFSCTPPESVRLQDYREQAADGYFAHIPVGLNAFDLALGETVDETERQLGKRIEIEETQNEQIKLCRFFIRHADVNADTLITCGFQNGRLSAVLAKTTFDNSIEGDEEFLHKIGKVFSFISELKNNINYSKSMNYVQTDNVLTCRYNATKTSNGFSGFEYMISYTNEVETFDLILNS
jgi:hypothetical protein